MEKRAASPLHIWLAFEVKLFLALLLIFSVAYGDYHNPSALNQALWYFIPIAVGVYFFRGYGLLTVALSALAYHLVRVFAPGGHEGMVRDELPVFGAFLLFGYFSLYYAKALNNLKKLNLSFSRIVGFQRAVLSAHPAGIVVVGNDGEIIEIGKTAEQLLGVEGKKWLGRKVQELQLSPSLKEKLEKSLAGSQDLYLEAQVIHWDCIPIYDRNSQENIGFAHILTDITERVNTQQRLLEQARLLSLKEARNRFAAHLHDDLAQMLSAIKMKMELAKNLQETSPLEAEREIHQSLEMLAFLLKDLRRSILELRPVVLEKKALVPALDEYLKQFAHYTSLDIEFSSPPDFSLSGELELLLFYIIQEAVTNAYKHSGSLKIRVGIAGNPSGWQAVIEDYGNGFEVEKALRGLGLTDMEEKARLMGAGLSIESRDQASQGENPGGTRIIVKYPA